MHELGIAKDLWAIIKEKAIEHKLSKVTKVVIAIGEASGIEKEFLEHSLKDHAFKGTLAENSAVVFEIDKLTARCRSCNSAITKDMMKGLSCPVCKSGDIEIVLGNTTYVKNIEGE
jgi:hydrogenase nickel incorporation protein HypA/HybF